MQCRARHPARCRSVIVFELRCRRATFPSFPMPEADRAGSPDLVTDATTVWTPRSRFGGERTVLDGVDTGGGVEHYFLVGRDRCRAVGHRELFGAWL